MFYESYHQYRWVNFCILYIYMLQLKKQHFHEKQVHCIIYFSSWPLSVCILWLYKDFPESFKYSSEKWSLILLKLAKLVVKVSLHSPICRALDLLSSKAFDGGLYMQPWHSCNLARPLTYDFFVVSKNTSAFSALILKFKKERSAVFENFPLLHRVPGAHLSAVGFPQD